MKKKTNNHPSQKFNKSDIHNIQIELQKNLRQTKSEIGNPKHHRELNYKKQHQRIQTEFKYFIWKR